MFVQSSEEFEKKQNFQKLFFYSKCSIGHVECSFNKQAKNFPPRFKKSFSSSYVTSNTNISKRIHIDKLNTTLTTRVKTLLPRIQKFHVSSPKRLKTYKTFKRIILSPNWYSEDKEYNFQFWYPCPKLFRQAR